MYIPAALKNSSHKEVKGDRDSQGVSFLQRGELEPNKYWNELFLSRLWGQK